MTKTMIDPKITKDLDNYLTYHNKLKRMKEVMGGEYRMEMNVESCRPLIEDGFELWDIVEYFILELRDYTDNRYQDDLRRAKEIEAEQEALKQTNDAWTTRTTIWYDSKKSVR